jgi:hypothetical protein
MNPCLYAQRFSLEVMVRQIVPDQKCNGALRVTMIVWTVGLTLLLDGYTSNVPGGKPFWNSDIRRWTLACCGSVFLVPCSGKTGNGRVPCALYLGYS